MSSKPLVVVCGATGAQGGSVVRALLKENKYAIRGLTRNPNAEAAQALTKQGVEMVQCDLSDRSAVDKAVKGAWAVFGLTNFWDPANHGRSENIEIPQGHNLVDCIKANNVEVFVWASLPDADRISNNVCHVPHLTDKNKIEQYAKQQAVNTISVDAGCYMQNFGTFFKAYPDKDGVKTISLPLRPDAGVAWFDVDDIGFVVAKVLRDPKAYYGHVLNLAPEFLTVVQLIEQYNAVTGDTLRYQHLPYDTFEKLAGKELTEMFKYFNMFGLFGGENVVDQKEFPLTKWTDYLKRTGYRA